MPDEVSVPVLCHHQLHSSQSYPRLAAIVNLANVVAHFLEDEALEKRCALPAASQAMELLELETEDLPRLLDLARSDVKRLHSSLVAQPSC